MRRKKKSPAEKPEKPRKEKKEQRPDRTPKPPEPKTLPRDRKKGERGEAPRPGRGGTREERMAYYQSKYGDTFPVQPSEPAADGTGRESMKGPGEVPEGRRRDDKERPALLNRIRRFFRGD